MGSNVRPRVLKPHAVRRDEILDAAEALVIEKGYEQMTVQDVLDTCTIAKGTFYHYFDSKQRLVESMLERRFESLLTLMTPIAEAPELAALGKLQAVFDRIGVWKQAEQNLLLGLLPLFYSEENVRVLQHARSMAATRLRPLLANVLEQGGAEGLALVAAPIDVADMVFALLEGAQAPVRRLLRAGLAAPQFCAALVAIVSAYSSALERLLGAPPGSIRLADSDSLRSWASALTDGNT